MTVREDTKIIEDFIIHSLHPDDRSAEAMNALSRIAKEALASEKQRDAIMEFAKHSLPMISPRNEQWGPPSTAIVNNRRDTLLLETMQRDLAAIRLLMERGHYRSFSTGYMIAKKHLKEIDSHG
jgi:hypothetical protein